ncbi:hypothetical protein ISS07_06680 [Candidatus Woesearchaeota archaeon]|nr:hypothetical protein [Candidatus Woesearchaeota archaeon]
MDDKDTLHIRVSQEIVNSLQNLVDKGMFSNKNEAIRESIRTILLKYKEEVER